MTPSPQHAAFLRLCGFRFLVETLVREGKGLTGRSGEADVFRRSVVCFSSHRIAGSGSIRTRPR